MGCAVGDVGCGCALDRTCTSGSCTAGLCATLTCVPGSDGCACSRGFTCVSGLECDVVEGTCPQVIGGTPSCTEGNLGCACLADDSCVGELSCISDACQRPECPAGTEGCGCLDGACGETPTGEELACAAGVCESPACPQATTGCACRNGLECDAADAVCVDGLCRSNACIPGSQGCACLAGSCNVGLQCDSGTVCIDASGRLSGPCLADGTCNRNGRCDDSVAPAICAFCDLGSQGCQCEDDNTCSPGLLCVEDHCVGDETVHARTPPVDPTCYTPCSDDLVEDDGSIRNCSAEGLLEGCTDDNTCVDGTCLSPGAEASMCFEDSDCPTFQLCMRGYCYAECEVDSECGQGMLCASKVCRAPCSLDLDTCPSGSRCESEDGNSGYCVAAASSEGTPQNLVEAELDVSTRVVRMTNISTEAEVQLINRGSQALRVTLAKVDHSIVYRDGTPEVVRVADQGEACTGAECPLWFLEMGQPGSMTQARTVEVQIPPRCEDDDSCPIITLRLAGSGVDAPRWRGGVAVQSHVGQALIQLSYVERAEGRWAGRMVYFANFEDRGIDSTTNPPRRGWLGRNRDHVEGESNNPNDLDVSNGLLLRWGAFRNGNLGGGWKEFQAVLTATEAEQWRFSSVANECPVSNGACYLFTDGTVGALPREYVTSLAATPIPTGVTTLPMAMNLYIPNEDEPATLKGRVFSETALHYAGNPTLTMRFEADPADSGNCDPDVPGHCVNFLTTAKNDGELDGLELDLSIGGRYEKQDGVACADGYEKYEFPWLVPGFLNNTSQVDGFYRKAWCVDYRLPDYDSTEILDEVRVENRSLARGNPIPDGQVLKRKVELLDGALIDQQQLLIFFRERFPSFLGGEDLVAYGYMVLERVPTELSFEDGDGDGVPDDYQGAESPDDLNTGVRSETVTCSAELLRTVLGGAGQVTSANAEEVIAALIKGNVGSNNQMIPPSGGADGCTGSTEEVHYLCIDTGLFNGGQENTSCWGRGEDGPNTDTCAGFLGNDVCDDGGSRLKHFDVCDRH